MTGNNNRQFPVPGTDEHVGACPMCGSTYDMRKHRLVECEECCGEGSTACCMPDGETDCQRCRDG